MRKRPEKTPLPAAFRQARQVFADAQVGGLGRDRSELTPSIIRSQRLHIEALMLRESSAQKDVDHRANCADGFAAVLRGRLPAQHIGQRKAR